MGIPSASGRLERRAVGDQRQNAYGRVRGAGAAAFIAGSLLAGSAAVAANMKAHWYNPA
jgi:hypothetical protein